MCNCINEIKKMIEDNSYYVPEDNARVVAVAYIEELIERLKVLPPEPSRYEIAMELYNEYVKENPYRTNFREWLEEKNK